MYSGIRKGEGEGGRERAGERGGEAEREKHNLDRQTEKSHADR